MSPQEELVSALPQLRAFARSRARSNADADDLVQRACVRILERIDQVPSGTGLVAYCITTIRNLHIDDARQRQRRGETTDFADIEDTAAGMDVLSQARVESTLETQDLERALRQIPEEFREVLILFGTGLSYDEIATHLEIPRGTVMSRLSRGRKQLRPLIGGDE